MNKAYFKIRNYNIPIIPEIQYNDLMDGTPDNMSFSFPSDENLSEIINIKEKCEIEIYNKDYPLVGTIDLENNTLVIDDTTYSIINENYINYNNTLVGVIDRDKKEIEINNSIYLYDNENNVYIDNRIHYYMCIAQISSEKMSTDADTGYMTTVLLNEQTVLLKDCIRTDIAITPSLYPVLKTKDSNGNIVEKNIFDNLLDATMKVVDCHNMCVLNEYIEGIDSDLSESLKQVACPNLTYRDLSTYSQLYDIFMRIGRIPYYENGILYGIKLQGTEDKIYDVSKYSSLSSLKETGTNDNIYSSKTYNNLYDNESAVVPQIFEDIIIDMPYFPKIVLDYNFDNPSIIEYKNDNNMSFYRSLPGYINFLFDDGIEVNDTTFKGIRVNPITGIPAEIFTLKLNITTWTVTPIAPVDQTIITKNEKEYVEYTSLGQKHYIQLSKSNTLTFDILDDYASSSSTIIPFKSDGTPNGEAINNWIQNEYRKWALLNYQDENDISKTLLFVRGYDYNSKNIEDARSYSLELPFNIELVEEIYSCSPIVASQKGTEGTYVTFGWKLEKYDNDRILENSLYESLSALQKRTTAYYVRGSNKINNVVCLNIQKESDDSSIWDVFMPLTSTEEDYQGAYAWSMTKVYNDLRKNFFVVKYKPILDTIYTNYDYHYGEENKPKAIKNFSLPYSQVTDKQVYPVLEYNLEKGLDTTHDIKFITDDINVLNIKAGDIVLYNGNKYITNKIKTYINNITFECNLSLTTNIIQNSIISSYQDNVRVSSLLSAETTVNRYVHLFAENVVRLLDYNEEGATERNDNYSYFTEEIGNSMSMNALHLLNLSLNGGDTYIETSKYPFRFDTILQQETDNNTNIEYYIKMSTGTSEDNQNYITLTDNDFPIKLYKTTLLYVTTGGAPSESDTNETIVNSPSELSSIIYNYAYYKEYFKLFFNIPISENYLTCITKNGTRYSLYPEDVKYDSIKVGAEPPLGNYRFYYSNQEYRTTNYGTEKMFSTSGKITKIEYSFPSSSYVTNTFLGSGIPDISMSYSSDYPQKQSFSNMRLLSCTPVLFNTTTYGCKLAGFGNKQEDFYSLYRLPHAFEKAYYLDLREIPRPYIQYKTLFRGSDVIEAKQLSSEVDFMAVTGLGFSPIRKFYLLKMPKFLNIDNFNIDDNWETYIKCELIKDNNMTPTHSAELRVSYGTLEHSDEYDYLLVAVIEETLATPEVVTKVLKFNIKEGHSVTKLCLRTEQYAEK